MKLSELAFACYIYGRMTDYDSSYRDFLRATGSMPNLDFAGHRNALLKWLNRWGCRQFARDYHSLASEEIRAWYQRYRNLLFSPERTLPELMEQDFRVIETAFQELTERTASMRHLRGKNAIITIGPTGAAKILFAIRPNALVPWDDPIREALRLDRDGESYAAYLGIVRTKLEELGNACVRNGHSLADLPGLVGRPESPLSKLIDEYFWVTVTRNCPTPPDHVLEQWMSWR